MAENTEKKHIDLSGDAALRRAAFAQYAKAVVSWELGGDMLPVTLTCGREALNLYGALAAPTGEDRALRRELCAYLGRAELALAAPGDREALRRAGELLRASQNALPGTEELLRWIEAALLEEES